MQVLCFDIGSGGITAARFNENLEAEGIREVSWDLHRDIHGSATLSADEMVSALAQLARSDQGGSPAAVSIACFMHSFLVLSSCCAPLTPVFTWLDTTEHKGINILQSRMEETAEDFHHRTGCRCHPMFPVFKLAARPAGAGNRVASPKALLAQQMTGEFVDDVGTASASGLLNIHSGTWDPEILQAVGLDAADLPRLGEPHEIIGTVTASGAETLGLSAGIKIVNGSGDGLLANPGSGCAGPDRIAVTLGTSAAARQAVAAPVLDTQSGTFCYRTGSDRFLLGCAGSNGGNALVWARELFGEFSAKAAADVPVFLPWLHGERSLEWDPKARASWHGLTAGHGTAELGRAVAEGVLFNLAHYVEVLQEYSGVKAAQVVLSGNGFKEEFLAPAFARLIPGEVLLPPDAGLATLRGAAVCAWRALGHDAMPAMERILDNARRISPAEDDGLLARFARFKSLRPSPSGRG